MSMYKTGELEMVMKQFEANPPKTYALRFDREKREIGEPFKHSAYYCDGRTNELFLAYFEGYALGKAIT